MKKIVLVAIFFCAHAMEEPSKFKSFFPQLLEGFIHKSRCSPGGKYYVSQAPCLTLRDPLHFHFAVHNVATRALLFEKKLTVAHLYKFSCKDSYLAISPDGITLEIVRPATGEITHRFTIGSYTKPENFDFCEEERFVRYRWLDKNHLFDLSSKTVVGTFDRDLENQPFRVELETRTVGIIVVQRGLSKYYSSSRIEPQLHT